MFKYTFQFILIISCISAQVFDVENVTAAQRTDGSHIVDVCYDLGEDEVFNSFRVSVEMTLDGGESWQLLTLPVAPNILGDNVLSGDSKCVTIDLNDFFKHW